MSDPIFYPSKEDLAEEIAKYLNFRAESLNQKSTYSTDGVMRALRTGDNHIAGVHIKVRKNGGGFIAADNREKKLLKLWQKRKVRSGPKPTFGRYGSQVLVS